VRSALVAGAAATLVLAGGCTGDDTEGISVAPVGRATVTEVVEAPASVEARASASLTATGDGRLEAVFVGDGQRVTAGSLVARIASPAAETRLDDARAQLVQIEQATPGAPAQIDLSASQAAADAAARDAFEAARRAAEQIPDPRLRAAALAQLVQAQRQYALARAQAEAAVGAVNAGIGDLSAALDSLTQAQRIQAQAAVDAAERAVAALTIRAPISGVVQLGGTASSGTTGQTGAGALDDALEQLPPEVRDQAGAALGTVPGGGSPPVRTAGPVTVGMPVSTGTPIATIVDTAVLSLIAEVDETDVFLVRPGVKASAELDAVPGARYAATVAAIDLSPTRSARGGVSYRVRLDLGRGRMPDGRRAPQPRPGMSAVADLRVRTAGGVIAVPAAAVVRAEDRDAVWVDSDGTARQRPITVGTQGADLVEVTEGLREGERVVVRGADRVRDGQDLP
jgi:HlyD family secretion protein